MWRRERVDVAKEASRQLRSGEVPRFVRAGLVTEEGKPYDNFGATHQGFYRPTIDMSPQNAAKHFRRQSHGLENLGGVCIGLTFIH